MPHSSKRALLVIDVQNEYFTGKLPISYPHGSLENVLAAMDAAHGHKVPVVAIQHAAPQPDSPVFRKGSKEWELHPEIVARPHDVLSTSRCPEASLARHWRAGCGNAASSPLPSPVT